MVFVEPRAGPALSSSPKHSISDRGVQQQQVNTQEGAVFNSNFPGKGENVTPASAIMCGREISRVDGDGPAQGSPEKESSFLGHGENRKQSALLRGFLEKSHPGPSLSRVQNKETSEQHVVIREPHIPKSVLLTSRSKGLKVSIKSIFWFNKNTFSYFPESTEWWGGRARRMLPAVFPLCKLEAGVRTVPSYSSQGLFQFVQALLSLASELKDQKSITLHCEVSCLLHMSATCWGRTGRCSAAVPQFVSSVMKGRPWLGSSSKAAQVAWSLWMCDAAHFV